MENSEKFFQPYTELVMSNAMLDCKMQQYESKIKCKTVENSKYEATIAEYKAEIKRLEKAIQTSRDQETKVKNNIDLLRNYRMTTEGLMMSMLREKQIYCEKREEAKKTRNAIIDKYSQIFASYRKVHDSLPWIHKNHELKIDIENKKIQLMILKFEYSSTKKKVLLFNKINEQRIQVEIIKLAQAIVERNNLGKEINTIIEQNLESRNKIEELKKEKLKIQEEKDLKVKAAVELARERAVKTQTNIGCPKPTIPPAVPSTTMMKSIFSRLGINGPLTLKRPARAVFMSQGTEANVPTKCVRTPDNCTPPERLWKQQEKITDNRGKEDMPTSSTHKPKLAKETECTGPENEVMTDTLDVNKESEFIENKQIITTVNSGSMFEERPNATALNADECRPLSTPSLQKSKTVRKDIETKNKKLKKKSKKTSASKLVKNVKFMDEKDAPPKVEIKDIETQEKESTTCATLSTETIATESLQSHSESKEDGGEIDAMEGSENVAEASIGNTSVPSLNFDENNEALNQTAGLDSPSFFIQRPQGYCFSPPFEKDSCPDAAPQSTQSPPDFMSSMSPLFSSKTKQTGGPATSFMDIFGTNSPKKSDNSTKSFFQLF